MMGRQLPPLSELARRLLADERQRSAEDEALKRRVLERASEALASDRPSGVALRRAAPSRPARRAPRAVLLVAAALAVAGLAAAGAGIYGLSEPAESPKVVVAPLVAPLAPPEKPMAPPLGARITAEPQADTAAREPLHAAPPAKSAQVSSVQQYAVELGVLDPARRSIARGDYAGAMGAIARHQREYPRGQLAEEREALRVRALWGTGQKASAESAAAVFRQRYPRSMLLSWMKEPAR
jgi:TolA-binding protein